MPDPLLLIAVGCATGFLAGFLGAGGGFATVVLLIAAGAPVHEAIGTSLIFTILIGLWGTILHLRQGTASVPLALALGLPSAATALGGAQIAEGLSERTLTLLFGILAAFIAVWMLRSPPARLDSEIGAVQTAAAADKGNSPVVAGEPPTGQFEARGRPLAVALAGGSVIGIMKGLFGVGGGFLLMPYMLLVLNIRDNVAVGSSLFAILIGSLVAGIRHATLGNVGLDMLPYLVPAGLVGTFVGTRKSKDAAPKTTRKVFVALLLGSTVYLLTESL